MHNPTLNIVTLFPTVTLQGRMIGFARTFLILWTTTSLVLHVRIWVALSSSRQKLARQREIKRKQSTEPLRHMTKSDVEKERASEYVIMPADKEMVFKEWWMKLDASDFASVQYPHARHGNAGRTSNSSKTSVMEDFFAFVDTNSQPNGQKADSTGHTFYFLLKFSTLQTPKAGCPHYEECLSRSVAGEFTVRNRQKSMF